MKMQQGFLYARVRNKALNNMLVSLGLAGIAGLFVGVGGQMYFDGEIPLPVLVIVGGIASVVGALFLLGAGLNFLEWRDPSRTDLFQGLARYGDPRDIVVEIEMELSGETERFGPVQFTDNWMVCTAAELHLVKYGELRLSRHTITAKRVKGIAVGEIHTLNWETDHEAFEMTVPTDAIDNLLLCLEQRSEPGSITYL